MQAPEGDKIATQNRWSLLNGDQGENRKPAGKKGKGMVTASCLGWTLQLCVVPRNAGCVTGVCARTGKGPGAAIGNGGLTGSGGRVPGVRCPTELLVPPEMGACVLVLADWLAVRGRPSKVAEAAEAAEAAAAVTARWMTLRRGRLACEEVGGGRGAERCVCVCVAGGQLEHVLEPVQRAARAEGEQGGAVRDDRGGGEGAGGEGGGGEPGEPGRADGAVGAVVQADGGHAAGPGRAVRGGGGGGGRGAGGRQPALLRRRVRAVGGAGGVCGVGAAAACRRRCGAHLPLL
eukprot:2875578-Rhodomonas_salina.1